MEAEVGLIDMSPSLRGSLPPNASSLPLNLRLDSSLDTVTVEDGV